MKIKWLHLENFRKHADSTLDLSGGAFVVIRGRNFAGKSSIKQGISLCFTPSTEGLDAAGRGFVSKIKRGASKAVITANIQGRHHLIQRVVTLNTNSTGRTPRSICLDDPDFNPASFDKQIEDNRAALTVVLNTDAFLRMDEREQKNLLAHLALPARYEFDRGKVEAVERVLAQEAPNFSGEPFEVIGEAYTKLFEERKIANRQVKDFAIPAPAVPPAVGLTSRKLEEDLIRLREERKQRMQERDQAVAAATTQEVGRVRVRSRIEALEEALRRDEEKAEAVRARLEPDDRLAYLRKLAAGKEERDRLGKEHEQQAKLLNSSEDQLAQLARIPASAKQCPTCEQALDGDRLAAMKGRVERQVTDEREAVSILSRKIRALGDVGVAVELVAGQEKVAKELASVESSLGEKKRQLEAARAELPVAAEFDFQPYDKTIQDCDHEIERLAGLLRPAIAAEERAKEIAVKTRQLASLKERAAVLDDLVRYFDKDGIKATLLKQYIGGFENKVNEVMSAWGYACSLSMDPYSFDVTNADGDTNPARELSGAERIMFSLAFQCAVSRTANIGLVVIDEVAMFLPELRPILNKRLYEMVQGGYLEQAILLVADASEQVPALPGATFFMVERGVVRELRPYLEAA